MHEVKVWDLPVRLFHWSLVAAFATAYISGENDMSIHEAAGYTVLGLIAFRIVWGFVGNQYARFSNFVYPPRDVLAYLRSLLTRHPKHYLGHNPAGGWMVLALLISLSIAGISGWQHDEADEAQHAAETAAVVVAGADHSPAIAGDKKEHKHAESAWEEVHEISVHVALILVFIHILGVFASSYLHKESLVRAMITGSKKH